MILRINLRIFLDVKLCVKFPHRKWNTKLENRKPKTQEWLWWRWGPGWRARVRPHLLGASLSLCCIYQSCLHLSSWGYLEHSLQATGHDITHLAFTKLLLFDISHASIILLHFAVIYYSKYMFWLSHSIVILLRAGRVSCLRDEPCPSPHRWTKYGLSLWRAHSVNNHWLMDDSVWSLTLKRGTWTVVKLLLCCSVVSVSLRPQGLQHSRFPCPSPSTGICLDLCISSRSK